VGKGNPIKIRDYRNIRTGEIVEMKSVFTSIPPVPFVGII